MNITYLNNTNWSVMSREERLYCAELYFHYRNNIPTFLQLLKEKVECIGEEDLHHEWELGYEVCFYRDYINHFKEKLYKKGVFNTFPRKRTFDLCLFSPNKIIIIEAKVHQRFDNKQLEYFKKDKNHLTNLFIAASYPVPDIQIIGLARSAYLMKQKYVPEIFRNNHFSWDDVYQQTQMLIFKQADSN